MSSLRYTKRCMVPQPKRPTRTGIQTTGDALWRLGFDSKFDFELERTADRIEASDVPIERTLDDAVQHAKTREQLVKLPCAHIRLSKELREDAEPATEDSLARVVDRVVGALDFAGVSSADVDAQVVDGRVQCTVQVCAGPWTSAIYEKLTAVTKDKGGGLERGDHSGIHKAFCEAGALENLSIKIKIRWALDRARLEFLLSTSNSGDLDDKHKDTLQLLVADSRSQYDEIWAKVIHEENTECIDELSSKRPMSRFQGELLPSAEGRQESLREDLVVQETACLADLMADAAQAQIQLKEVLAPRSSWAQLDMNNAFVIKADDKRRHWESTSRCLAQNASCFDPGIIGERQAFEQAKRLQWPHLREPPVEQLVDLSSIRMVFTTFTDICVTLDRVLANSHLEVVWVENDFFNPNILGYRSMTVGVRQKVESRSHISVLTFHLKVLHELQQVSSTHLDGIKSLFASNRMGAADAPRLSEILMTALALTSFSSRKGTIEEVISVAVAGKAAAADQDGGEAGKMKLELFDKLLNEVVGLAVASGVPQAYIEALVA